MYFTLFIEMTTQFEYNVVTEKSFRGKNLTVFQQNI